MRTRIAILVPVVLSMVFSAAFTATSGFGQEKGGEDETRLLRCGRGLSAADRSEGICVGFPGGSLRRDAQQDIYREPRGTPAPGNAACWL